MATTIGELTWKVSADTKNIDASMKKTEAGMTKFGKVVAGAFSVAVVAAFAKAALDLGKKMIGLASDAEETANKFNVVFAGLEDASGAAQNLAENYGLSSTASQMLLADTADLLQGFGVTKEESLKLSEATQKLAADLASFANKDPIEASKALTSALLGEREAVKSLGIAITDAELKRFAEEQGQVFEEMDKAAKAVLTLELAYKQSANAIGDFERSNDSFANQLKIARANVVDLGTSIGEELLPAATQAVTKFNELIGTIIEAREAAKEFLEAETAVEEGTATLNQQLEVAQARLVNLRIAIKRSQDLGQDTSALDRQREQLMFDIMILEQSIEAAAIQQAIDDRQAENDEKLRIAREKDEADEAIADEERLARLLEYQEAERQALLDRQALADAAFTAANEEAELWNLQRQLLEELHDAEAEAEAERHAQKIQNLQDELSFYSDYAGNIGTIFNNLIQVQMAGDEELTDQKKKNIIALYRIQQAANIAQIAIDTAAAIVKAWVSPGFPLAIPLTALIAGMGITQAAVVAATPPPVQLQSGGIIPARPGGTSAVIGEAGQAEAVIPLDDDNGFGNVRVMINLDGQVLADFTQKALNNRDIIVDAGSVS